MSIFFDVIYSLYYSGVNHDLAGQRIVSPTSPSDAALGYGVAPTQSRDVFVQPQHFDFSALVVRNQGSSALLPTSLVIECKQGPDTQKLLTYGKTFLCGLIHHIL